MLSAIMNYFWARLFSKQKSSKNNEFNEFIEYSPNCKLLLCITIYEQKSPKILHKSFPLAFFQQ